MATPTGGGGSDGGSCNRIEKKNKIWITSKFWTFTKWLILPNFTKLKWLYLSY